MTLKRRHSSIVRRASGAASAAASGGGAQATAVALSQTQAVQGAALIQHRRVELVPSQIAWGGSCSVGIDVAGGMALGRSATMGGGGATPR